MFSKHLSRSFGKTWGDFGGNLLLQFGGLSKSGTLRAYSLKVSFRVGVGLVPGSFRARHKVAPESTLSKHDFL